MQIAGRIEGERGCNTMDVPNRSCDRKGRLVEEQGDAMVGEPTGDWVCGAGGERRKLVWLGMSRLREGTLGNRE
jgi:hypothetical protein